MPVRVKVDTSGSDELFRKMGWTLKNSLPGFMRQEARLVAVELARRTQPFGANATTQKVGQVATSRDIYHVYATPGAVFKEFVSEGTSKAFWLHYKAKRYTEAQVLIKKFCPKFSGIEFQDFDGGASHRQLRNNQGRIPKSQKPVMIVKDPKKLEAYVKAEEKKVGTGKGGWSTCAAQLGGTRGIPGWVSRQNAPARVIEQYRTDISKVIMTNLVPYASEILTEYEKQNAINDGKYRLGLSVKKAIMEIPHRG